MDLNNVSNNSISAQYFKKLDAMDGKIDNKVDASIWNQFAKTAGGKNIKYAIAQDNAMKSINYYLKKGNLETKEAIAQFVNSQTSNSNDQVISTNQKGPVLPQQLSSNNQTFGMFFEPTQVASENQGLPFQPKLEEQPQNTTVPTMLIPPTGNEAEQISSTSQGFGILFNPTQATSENQGLPFQPKLEVSIPKTEVVADVPEIETKNDIVVQAPKIEAPNTTQKQPLNVSSEDAFERDTSTLNALKYEHKTRLLDIAQDSLGLYEITPKEYNYLLKNNPEELKNTQAKILSDSAMRAGHQWCAYTVSYFAKEAGLQTETFAQVNQFLSKYEDDYNKIDLGVMTKDNYETIRVSRAVQIEAQLPNMNEGDFIIWKGQYWADGHSVPTASHIGIIENVDVENGIVAVIEGNANVSEMDANNERILVRTQEQGQRGNQAVGKEYIEVNKRDGLIRKQYTIEELSKHGYSGFIDNSSRIK